MPLNIEKNSYILLRIKTKTKIINTILIRNEMKEIKEQEIKTNNNLMNIQTCKQKEASLIMISFLNDTKDRIQQNLR